MTPFALIIELNLVLAIWLSLGVWQKDRSTPGRRTFALLALTAATWCAGEMLGDRGTVSELAADRVKYAGILCMPAFWLAASAHAARLDLVRRVPWLPIVLLSPGVCAYALMYAGPWSGLFLTTVDGVGNDLRGPVWWLVTGYHYVLMVGGSATLIGTALRRRRRGWGRLLALGIASLLPLAASFAYLISGLSWSHDLAPALLGISLIVLRSAIFSGGLLQILPLTQHDLLTHLPLPALLADRRGTVIAINPAAEQRLGLSARDALGRAFDAVVEGCEAPPQTDITPIRSQTEESGQLILLDLQKS